MGPDTEGISCCFDKESRGMYEDYKRDGLGETAVAIANAAIRSGLAGSTVLEVGCGIGALSMELLERGAAGAVGIDLSPKMIHLARALAAEKKMSARAAFTVGDGARERLTPSTIVILDAVLCCYPEVEALVKNSSAAALRFYAISIPDDARFLTRLLKFFLPVQGLVLRRDKFRFYVHPSRTITERLEGAGFRLDSRSKAGWIWSVYVFSRR